MSTAEELSNRAKPTMIAQSIWLLVLICFGCKPGENKYGPNPNILISSSKVPATLSTNQQPTKKEKLKMSNIRVSSDGKVWNGGSVIGRVTPDGKVWNDGYGGSTVGRVTPDGRVWNDGYGGSTIGRVTSDGKVWNDGYGGSVIGQITDGDILAGGAALLLLLR